ncbi:MAG: response regulator [Spirochaetes bacterium]|nr:response regulator [Spirochaetota bacterium]
MNLLLIDQKNNIRNILIRRLFPKGINVYHSETLESVNKFLSTVKINIILIDIDYDLDKSFKFLNTLSNLKNKPVRIILSSISNRNTIIPFVNTGIAGFIMKPFSEDKGLSKILQIVQNISENDEKRSFYRVSMDPNEDKKVFFRLQTDTRLKTGQVINISAGGIAIESTDKTPLDEMEAGLFIPKIQLKLDHQDLFLSGKVAYKKGGIFAVVFDNSSTHDKDLGILSHYIFKKISMTI